MHVEIVDGSIVEVDTEVIVNAWNRNIVPWFLLLPHGVSAEIKRSAGSRPFNELLKLGPMPLGSARITTAGKLDYEAIIHVAGIDIFWRASEASVRKSVRSAMRLVKEHSFLSVAFPIIGAGSGGLGREAALEAMLDAFRRIDSEARVVVVRYKRSTG